MMSVISSDNLAFSTSFEAGQSRQHISVIMPAYNAAAYIHDAIASILRQTHCALELIIIDDGSYDDTARRAEVFEKLDSRVRVFRTDHRGMSLAMNKGIASANYEWIAVMPADDVALPHRLETQLRNANEDPSVIAWGSQVQYVNSRLGRAGVSRTGPTTHDEFRVAQQQHQPLEFHHSTLLVRRQSLESIGGYNINLIEGADIDLIARLAQLGDVLTIPETLMLYRVHETSFTMRHYFEIRQRIRLIHDQEHRESALDRLNDVARYLYRRAGLAFAEGDLLDGLFNLAISTALAPHYALPRLWKQRIGALARRELNRPISLSSQPVRS